MAQHLFLTAVLVRDYDEAIAFYVDKLGFELRLDNRLSETRRWVVLAPAGGGQGCILLARAEGERQLKAVGEQTGGRVFLFLHTDDFWRDYQDMRAQEIQFVEGPREEPYGKVAVFLDLYGNRWDLVHPKPAAQPGE